MLTWRETEYQELWPQSPQTETFGQQTSEATRVFLVDWQYRQQAMLDFLGYSVAESGESGDSQSGIYNWISRVTPAYHPDYLRDSDNQPYLYADSVTIEPFGMPVDDKGNPQYGEDRSTLSIDDTPLYNKAKMTVHYGTRLYTILDDDEMGMDDESTLVRYVEFQRHPQAEYLTLPNGTFKYASDSTAVPGAPGKIQAMNDLTLVWRQVPRLMIASSEVVSTVVKGNLFPAAMDYTVGRVNSTAIWGYSPGQLLCEPMELTPWRQADGEIVFDVTFHFKFFRLGHNNLLRLNSTTNKVEYDEVSSDGEEHPEPAPDGVHLYDSCEFRDLFRGYYWSAGRIVDNN